MIHAIILDLDGTLVHSLPGLTASLNRVLSVNRLPLHPEEKVRGFIGNGIHKLVERASPAELDHALLDSLCQQMSDDYAASWKDGSAPYPGIAKTLHRLSQEGIELAVFSNKPHIFCQKMTDTLLPGIAFKTVLGQRDGTAIKPDPAGALEIAKRLALQPDQIAFLGDSTIDIATARNAGMLPIAATWGYHDIPALEAEHPAHIIHNIEELPALILS